MKNLKIEIPSYLPLFRGFYNSLYEPDFCEEEEAADNFDYKAYYLEASKLITKQIESSLQDILGDKIELHFEDLISPKYYNYSTDTINVNYILDTNTLLLINSYLKLNKSKFSTYLKENYTSYDGFMSFHSTDVKEWSNITENSGDIEHKFGSVLNFILLNEEIDEEDIYMELMDELRELQYTV